MWFDKSFITLLHIEHILSSNRCIIFWNYREEEIEISPSTTSQTNAEDLPMNKPYELIIALINTCN